jgi:hypothetical protein
VLLIGRTLELPKGLTSRLSEGCVLDWQHTVVCEPRGVLLPVLFTPGGGLNPSMCAIQHRQQASLSAGLSGVFFISPPLYCGVSHHYLHWYCRRMETSWI